MTARLLHGRKLKAREIALTLITFCLVNPGWLSLPEVVQRSMAGDVVEGQDAANRDQEQEDLSGDATEALTAGFAALARHHHAPIYIRSRPVIERLSVHVSDPVDLCVSSRGLIYVADRRAKAVFRLQQDGNVDRVAADLEGIQRISVDLDGTLYILTSTSGSGRIYCVTPGGLAAEIHAVNFPPVSFARDQTGILIIAAQSGRIVQIEPDGQQTELAVASEAVRDLTLSTSDQIHVLLQSGRVVYLGRDGSSRTVGRAPEGALRLCTNPDGQLAVLHTFAGSMDGTRRSSISLLHEGPDADIVHSFAHVPVGTAAVAFDSLGNLCLANPEMRAITRVTSRFVVPCPHCGQSLKVILTTNPPACDQQYSDQEMTPVMRSF